MNQVQEIIERHRRARELIDMKAELQRAVNKAKYEINLAALKASMPTNKPVPSFPGIAGNCGEFDSD